MFVHYIATIHVWWCDLSLAILYICKYRCIIYYTRLHQLFLQFGSGKMFCVLSHSFTRLNSLTRCLQHINHLPPTHKDPVKEISRYLYHDVVDEGCNAFALHSARNRCSTVKYDEKKIHNVYINITIWERKKNKEHRKRKALDGNIHTHTNIHIRYSVHIIQRNPTTSNHGGTDYLWRLLSEFIDRSFAATPYVRPREPVAFGWKEIPFLPPEVGPFWRLSLRKCFDPQCQRRQVTVRVLSPIGYVFLLRTYHIIITTII